MTRIEDRLAVGTGFTLKKRGIDAEITSQAFVLAPMVRTLWGGVVDGIMGIHEWRFDGGASKTTVRTVESWSGSMAAEDPAGMQAALDGSLERWSRFLKRRAEKWAVRQGPAFRQRRV